MVWAQPRTNELGDPLQPVNELGDPLPVDNTPWAAPPSPPTPGQQRIASDQAALDKVHFAQSHPWGTPENHPSVVGKIGHVLSTAANIAGDIFAPAVTANIPGSGLNMERKEGQLAKRLNTEITNEGLNQERAAATGKENAETAEVAPNAASSRRLQGANTEHIAAETNALEHPQPEYTNVPGELGPQGQPVSMEKHSGQYQLGDVSGLERQSTGRPDTPEQQFIDEYHQRFPNSTVADAIRAYTDTTQRPPQSIMLVPGQNGTYQAQNVRPGSVVQPGAVNPSGLNSLNVPDSSTRTMVANAPGVIDLANRVNQLIDQQVQSLGPAAGRWNEFMSGRIGAPNPQFRQLQTDVKLLKTKLMRMHVGARGGEYIMKSFDDMLDAGKDSPENLKAALTEITSYANDLQHEAQSGQLSIGGQGRQPAAPTPNATPPRPAGVPENAQYITNPKTGKKGWAW